VKCDVEYDDSIRKNKPGKIIECSDCAEDGETRYTGNVIYDHKTAASLQINKDPNLTKYIINATKLRNKGSNLGNNAKVSSFMAKSFNACHVTAGSKVNAKGKH
jgi:hypothetical protein